MKPVPNTFQSRSLQTLTALLLCLPACSFQASINAGPKNQSDPEATPSETAPEAQAGTETARAQPAAPAETQTPKANVQVKGSQLSPPGPIIFIPDEATLAQGAGNEAVLGEVSKYLEQNSRVTLLRIEGHTHNLRPEDQAMELSGQRARAVKQWLIGAGIHEGRLLAVGFGQTRPVADNSDPAGQAQNERVSFRIAELDGRPYMGSDPTAGGQEFP